MPSISPLKRKPRKHPIYSFDIETIPGKNDFLLGRILGPTCDKVFFNKKDMCKFIHYHKPLYKKSAYLVATNLGFDAMALYENTKYGEKLHPLFQGGNMIYAEYRPKKGQRIDRIRFIDTMNFFKVSLETLGKVINVPKMPKPAYILEHRAPRTEEIPYIVKYNKNDCIVTLMFMAWLQDELNSIGAEMKITAASSSMHLFKHKFLKDTWWREPEASIKHVLKAYYGGRTEAFKRGYTESPLFYYDINSMYPYVMKNNYPNAQTSVFKEFGSLRLIEAYEGVSDVDIFCPEMNIPYLPFKTPEGKLVFCTGSFSGYYTHYELRKAQTLGYKILGVRNTVYYRQNHAPFTEMIDILYALRMEYKKEKNPAELVVKLLMNSNYGKWGEKPRIEKKILHMNNIEQSDWDKAERLEGDYLIIPGKEKIVAHSFPIYAVYTTAYARTLLYELMKDNNPYYVDTDSIITESPMPTSDKLGELKLEHMIDEICIIRPKMYALRSGDKELCRVKGLPPSRKWSFDDFRVFLGHPRASYIKFAKFKESLRRNLKFNEEITVEKELCLEDNKRRWPGPFDDSSIQNSMPLHANKGVIAHEETVKTANISRFRGCKPEPRAFGP
jgi:hypothetical protein